MRFGSRDTPPKKKKKKQSKKETQAGQNRSRDKPTVKNRVNKREGVGLFTDREAVSVSTIQICRIIRDLFWFFFFFVCKISYLKGYDKK